MGLFSSSQLPAEATEFASALAPRIYPLAYSLTGRRADAEDLVQDTLLQVLTRWERVDRADRREAYVRQIVVNTFLSGKRRKSSTEITVAAVDEQVVSQDLAGAVADHLDLWARLGTLDRRPRAVLVLRYYEDLPDAVIATLLGMSVGNVRVVAHRALATLRSQTAVAT